MQNFLHDRGIPAIRIISFLIGVAKVLSSVDYFRRFFEQLKSDWSKPKKAALITVTAIIMVFGY